MVTRIQNSNEEREFELCPEGEHICTLKLKDCEVAKWAKRNGELVKLPDKRPGIRFVWQVEGKPWYITKSVGNTTSERGQLFKLMQECADSILREIQFDKKGFAKEADVFYDVLDGLTAYKYKVLCSHFKGETQTFCNFESCIPLKEEKVSQGVIKDADLSLQDDDIPF